jgi:hypothetical protein
MVEGSRFFGDKDGEKRLSLSIVDDKARLDYNDAIPF